MGSQSAAVGKGRPWEENEGGGGEVDYKSRPASNLGGGICVERVGEKGLEYAAQVVELGRRWSPAASDAAGR